MYDLIVVGGGHAGCEAAHIGAVLGLKTALITASIKNIADMPCNPSIGGTAKGIGIFSQAIAVATNKTTSNVTSVNNLAKREPL